MHLERRIRNLERAASARIASATDQELEAYVAHPLDPALEAELATWTNEQLDAAIAGMPLAMMRAMRPAAKCSDPTTTRS